MSVTVGIPTTGERPVLRRTVEAAIRSAAMLGEDAEVLVMVNGRSDAPGLDPIDAPALRVSYLPRPNAAGARNALLAQARHDTVLLVDDDVIVPEPWCTELAAALRDGSCPVATVPVRVWVHGPVTAFINYQRAFDSQPPGPADPGSLVTANCGLRRDLLPARIRFDENLDAGDDTDLGHQLWDAGLPFRVLSTATPVTHELPEEIAPHLRRSLRYGDSTAKLMVKRDRVAELRPRISAWYAAMTGPEHQDLRSFGEFASQSVRSAFSIYAFILNSTYVVGCLDALAAGPKEAAIKPDLDRLLTAWQVAADRATAQVSELSAADWRDLDCDYARLLRGAPDASSGLSAAVDVIADLKAELRAHAPLTPAALTPAGSGGAGLLSVDGSGILGGGPKAGGRPAGPPGGQGPAMSSRLGPALDELRTRPGPIREAELNRLAQENDLSFRALLQIIERKFRAKPEPGRVS